MLKALKDRIRLAWIALTVTEQLICLITVPQICSDPGPYQGKLSIKYRPNNGKAIHLFPWDSLVLTFTDAPGYSLECNFKETNVDDRDKYLQQYVQYIRNTGQVPLKAADFDEDWDPIGPQLREEMVTKGLISEGEDGLRIIEP